MKRFIQHLSSSPVCELFEGGGSYLSYVLITLQRNLQNTNAKIPEEIPKIDSGIVDGRLGKNP